MMVDSESADWVVPETLRMLEESGDEGVIAEFLELFRSDTTTRLQTMRGAFAAGDLAQVRAQAHAIKGSANQVGATSLGELCRQLELESAGKSTGEVAILLQRVGNCFERTCSLMFQPQAAGRQAGE